MHTRPVASLPPSRVALLHQDCKAFSGIAARWRLFCKYGLQRVKLLRLRVEVGVTGSLCVIRHRSLLSMIGLESKSRTCGRLT